MEYQHQHIVLAKNIFYYFSESLNPSFLAIFCRAEKAGDAVSVRSLCPKESKEREFDCPMWPLFIVNKI